MVGSRASIVLTNWNTTRYELLNTRVCDLGLRIEGSPLEPYVRRVSRELERKGFTYTPLFYLTDTWGCPDEVPAIGIPFYLADRRLMRIEEEQTGEVENHEATLAYLRHEAGHAVNYAYRLWRRTGWTETFGRFSKPYHDAPKPDTTSRAFVRHLTHSSYGRFYAQRHPDEDFAETFAIWLTPRADWRRRYRDWPAIRKLKYVDTIARMIRRAPPRMTGGRLLRPVSEMTLLLAEHYGQRAERYRAAAEGYVDDKLRLLFPASRGRGLIPAGRLIEHYKPQLVDSVVRWSGLAESDAVTIVSKLQDRAATLRLRAPRGRMAPRLIDMSSLVTSLGMDFAYTGRFTG